MSLTMAQAVGAFSPALPLAVAYSGGADSTALLLACVEKWPGQVRALHVHHGLQAAADDFEQHCRRLCTRLDVPLMVKKVDARPARGQSPEDAARSARYKAFELLAGDFIDSDAVKTIAIAQHADDQMETVMLALSRGSGLPGLSGMKASWVRAGVTYCRPFLSVRGSEIRAWLAERQVPFIEDPTNADVKFTRNRIRARLLPALDATFPQFRDTFARSAAHIAQAQEILLEVANQDLVGIGTPPEIRRVQALSRSRQVNVLRHWLLTTHLSVPSAAQMSELLDQIDACRTRGHQICIKVAAGFVERKGDVLHWYNPAVLH